MFLTANYKKKKIYFHFFNCFSYIHFFFSFLRYYSATPIIIITSVYMYIPNKIINSTLFQYVLFCFFLVYTIYTDTDMYMIMMWGLLGLSIHLNNFINIFFLYNFLVGLSIVIMVYIQKIYHLLAILQCTTYVMWTFFSLISEV